MYVFEEEGLISFEEERDFVLDLSLVDFFRLKGFLLRYFWLCNRLVIFFDCLCIFFKTSLIHFDRSSFTNFFFRLGSFLHLYCKWCEAQLRLCVSTNPAAF